MIFLMGMALGSEVGHDHEPGAARAFSAHEADHGVAVVVAIDPSKANQLSELAEAKDIKLSKIGTTGGDALVINDAVISLTELRKAHTETFPRLFG